jgi:hypothetical protein
MKKSQLVQIIREEIRNYLNEYGSELMYYNAPGGFEQAKQIPELRLQRFSDPERWRIIAMQLGATIQDRGDDWIAILPNKEKIGTFSKMNQFGTLELYS